MECEFRFRRWSNRAWYGVFWSRGCGVLFWLFGLEGLGCFLFVLLFVGWFLLGLGFKS